MWQPIETAPDDELLLYFPSKVVGAYAQSTLPAMRKVGRVSEYPNRPPSHWMPIPPDPTDRPISADKFDDLNKRST